MTDTDEMRERLRNKLDGCVQTGRVKLSSGRETDFYFDGRLVSLDPEGSVLIASLVLEEIKRLGVDAVGGLTSGADPITSSVGVLAFQQGVPLRLFYVRKASKGHGTQRRVEGPPLPETACVALVDDVLTTGKSLLAARDALREETGLAASDVVVIIDREEGGREKLDEEGLAVHSLFRKADFLS